MPLMRCIYCHETGSEPYVLQRQCCLSALDETRGIMERTQLALRAVLPYAETRVEDLEDAAEDGDESAAAPKATTARIILMKAPAIADASA